MSNREIAANESPLDQDFPPLVISHGTQEVTFVDPVKNLVDSSGEFEKPATPEDLLIALGGVTEPEDIDELERRVCAAAIDELERRVCAAAIAVLTEGHEFQAFTDVIIGRLPINVVAERLKMRPDEVQNIVAAAAVKLKEHFAQK